MKRILKKYVKKILIIDEYTTSKISNMNYKLYGKEDKGIVVKTSKKSI